MGSKKRAGPRRPIKKKHARFLWFIYQDGVLDFVSFDIVNAEEMAESPEGDREPYTVERWRFVDGGYHFDRHEKIPIR